MGKQEDKKQLPEGGSGNQRQSEDIPPLDSKEKRKRRREGFLIVFLLLLFLSLMVAEFQITRLSSVLPFVNSIFFFGLLNINIIILVGLVYLVFRNIGKVFIERRRKVLGARLKTKLVIAFLAFSIIPTLVLFVISAMYINSSFDKWFSLKIQNTLQASLEITGTYYRNTEQNAMHFAEHLARGISKKMKPQVSEQRDQNALDQEFQTWMQGFLNSQRELLSLDAVEFYPSPDSKRFLSFRKNETEDRALYYPSLALDLLDRAHAGEKASVIQHIGTGDLIRCVVPVRMAWAGKSQIIGVLAVDSYIPIGLRNKVDEIASVFDDYKDTNPLKYPMKTTYFVILVMITLVILFVAIWIGLYIARELTVPVERLVQGAREVGSGNLDVTIAATGQDEISVLVQSFNRMTMDLKDNRKRLIQASEDLEKRRLQLEAVLANIGTGVIAVDHHHLVTTFNSAAGEMLGIDPQATLKQPYFEVLQGEGEPLRQLIDRAFEATSRGKTGHSEATQWNYRSSKTVKVLAAVATSLNQGENNWGVVIVIDDMTHLIKGQREMAWREVARRIAHEIKNPLTPIKLSAQRLRRRFRDTRGQDGDILRECTDTIIRHTDELKEMVNEFSNFARFPLASPAPHDLNQALSEVVSLFQQAHPEIHYDVSLESRMPVFEFDRDQIKRVVINLFDNGIAALAESDAIKRGDGQIRIASHYNDKLQMAVIEVQDNGVGMENEVKDRVFEPYFSTKKEGTGLGLSIVKRIINDHDGFIRVRSVPEQGTLFLIEIPAKTHPSASSAQFSEPSRLQESRDGEIKEPLNFET